MWALLFIYLKLFHVTILSTKIRYTIVSFSFTIKHMHMFGEVMPWSKRYRMLLFFRDSTQSQFRAKWQKQRPFNQHQLTSIPVCKQKQCDRITGTALTNKLLYNTQQSAERNRAIKKKMVVKCVRATHSQSFLWENWKLVRERPHGRKAEKPQTHNARQLQKHSD